MRAASCLTRIAFLFLSTLPAVAQVDWWSRYPATTPVTQYFTAACYAAGRGVLAFDDRGALWSYDGDWRLLDASVPFAGNVPAARAAYDESRARLVVCVGQAGGPAYNPVSPIDVWEWDGTSWTHPVPSGPPTRIGFALVYHPVRQRIVLFGGKYIGLLGLGGTLHSMSDLWEWDGSQWVQLPNSFAPRNVPPGSYTLVYNNLAYDVQRDSLVTTTPTEATTGTYNPGPRNLSYEWTGSAWVPIANLPVRMTVGSLYYDAYRARMVVMGQVYGYPPNYQVLIHERGESGAWIQRTTPTVPPQAVPLAYDAARHVAVAYDQMLVTWEFGTTRPARVLPFGTGCGSPAPLGLGNAAGSVPWLGAGFAVDLRSVPIGSPAVLAIELVPTPWPRWNGPLDSLGMPGCMRYCHAPTFLPPTPAGATQVVLQMPANPIWSGSSFCMQAVAIDRAANPAGLVTSNALIGVIGER
jgi:hypothetical protein